MVLCVAVHRGASFLGGNMAQAPRVLVVDDEQLDRWILCHALRDARCEVLEASNGLEAISLIEREDPDLVFLDLHMKRLDGFAVLEQLEKIGATCQVVIVSCELNPKLQWRALKLGAVEFLNKPVSVEQLTAAVLRLTGQADPQARASADAQA